MTEEKAIAHLEARQKDIRDEIKKRIEQRNKYSIQLTIALGVIVVVSFSNPDLRKVLIAAPLVSIYFTMLILYSYRVHHVLTSYLRYEIEPELARLCGTSPEKEWETYYQGKAKAVPGIRRPFFLVALWAVYILSFIYLWAAERDEFTAVLVVVTIVYLAAAVIITKRYGGKQDS